MVQLRTTEIILNLKILNLGLNCCKYAFKLSPTFRQFILTGLFKGLVTRSITNINFRRGDQFIHSFMFIHVHTQQQKVKDKTYRTQ